ncbi:3-deoxy-D-manno-octulosonic acid transferase [Pseudodonghicola xiamenensis]|uniref:3-deoxy-D-manno-octulosonic acid transferase n=1 Tax=Pseudodonghicola xiamenensis TaxID=337702 RepID=A0A8J3MDC5_9RHOB|nr:glycosyltransferase N-terminal domain-containing protein [Pseudodonghicola xiamenensis]GHG82317.1 3-deoxy-D-manno-octulosonic acid transferase [Pseudodonghicola xiamenensis]
MRLSLGLAAYRALSWRAAQPVQEAPPPRPDGSLLWLHATSAERFSALSDLGQRLCAHRPDVNLLLTVNAGVSPSDPATGHRIEGRAGPVQALISDHPTAVRDFLAHWRPDICLWTGGDLMPNLICMATDEGTEMIIADIGNADLPRRRNGWLSDVTGPCLMRFDALLADTAETAAHLRRLGLPGRKISAMGRLSTGASPPPCPETALNAATQALAGRPLWLAALLDREEIAPVLAAHREALRFQHRLLLVAVPTDPDDSARLISAARDNRLRCADWHGGDPIGEDTQILICDDSSDLGLWYRMAPLTFIGGSLRPGARGNSPYEATALGSAVLYGPHITDHTAAYTRLTTAGAARAVRDMASLTNAVVQLCAPDHAAAMALAGWETLTESAALTDHLIEMIQDRLDRREAAHAHA